MIGVDVHIFEILLHGDSNGGAAAPDADQQIRPETAVIDVRRQPEGVQQQFIGGDIGFLHDSGVRPWIRR